MLLPPEAKVLTALSTLSIRLARKRVEKMKQPIIVFSSIGYDMRFSFLLQSLPGDRSIGHANNRGWRISDHTRAMMSHLLPWCQVRFPQWNHPVSPLAGFMPGSPAGPRWQHKTQAGPGTMLSCHFYRYINMFAILFSHEVSLPSGEGGSRLVTPTPICRRICHLVNTGGIEHIS
jgi:hypothetical protein